MYVNKVSPSSIPFPCARASGGPRRKRSAGPVLGSIAEFIDFLIVIGFYFHTTPYAHGR